MSTTRPEQVPTAPLKHLTQIDLARRWRMSERTLERWRWQKKGIPHLKLGGRVVYRLEDVLAYEAGARSAPRD